MPKVKRLWGLYLVAARLVAALVVIVRCLGPLVNCVHGAVVRASP